MKPEKTWILIANSIHARIVENDGPGKGLFQPPGLTRETQKRNAFSDQPGRAFTSSGSSRSKMEPHQKVVTGKDSFAGKLVDELMSHHKKGDFDWLVLCAAPAMLAQLRSQMPDQLRSKLIAELSKDLTNTPVEDLATHFDDVLQI